MEVNLTKLYNRMKPIIMNYYFVRSVKMVDAEELFNNTILKVANSIDTFNENLSAFDTWVFNIAKNELIDFWRKENISRRVEMVNVENFLDNDVDGYESVINRFGITNNDVHTELIQKELGILIDEHVELLDEKQRLFFKEYFYNNKTIKEIAMEYNVSLGTVKPTLMRAKNKLKESLKSKLNFK